MGTKGHTNHTSRRRNLHIAIQKQAKGNRVLSRHRMRRGLVQNSLALSETAPHSRISAIEVQHCDVSTRNPTPSPLVGPSTLSCLHDTKVLCGQRNGDGSRAHSMLPTEPWTLTCGVDWKNTRKAIEELKDTPYGSRDKKLQDLTTKADEGTLVPRTTYERLIWLSSPQRNVVTVIGD